MLWVVATLSSLLWEWISMVVKNGGLQVLTERAVVWMRLNYLPTES